jgi:hypothetical protein
VLHGPIATGAVRRLSSLSGPPVRLVRKFSPERIVLRFVCLRRLQTADGSGNDHNRCQRINHSVPRFRFRLRWPSGRCLLLPLAGWLRRSHLAQNLGPLDPAREIRDRPARRTRSRTAGPGDSDFRICNSSKKLKPPSLAFLISSYYPSGGSFCDSHPF